MASVRHSPLLRPEVVTFIEGPSQLTLPRHQFENPLQLILLDGPHAYPFPDLEYYYLYRYLDPEGLLIIDDIQIRTINNLFQFLRRDPMFRLEEVVRTTAFFVRTGHPVFDPLTGRWSEQPYNAKPVVRYGWREPVRRLLPQAVLLRLEHLRRWRHARTASRLGSPNSEWK